jgi:hypothetical protein
MNSEDRVDGTPPTYGVHVQDIETPRVAWVRTIRHFPGIHNVRLTSYETLTPRNISMKCQVRRVGATGKFWLRIFPESMPWRRAEKGYEPDAASNSYPRVRGTVHLG